MPVGLGLPIVQQVTSRAQAWEAEAGPAELVHVAQAADRLGFAWITCSDHVAVPRSYVAAMGATWYDPLATLAFLAAHTSRIGLLSHVLVLPYRHPLLVAKGFATLDRLAAGRVILGVGVGHLKPEFRSLGVGYDERSRRTEESLRALRVALDEECSSFAGEFSTWREMVVGPRPVRRLPLWVGGNGPAAARRAARLGDGWVPWQLDLEQFRERSRLLRDLGVAREFTLVAPEHFAATDTAADLRRRLEQWSAAGATDFHLGVDSRTLEHLLERLQEIADAGLTSAQPS